MSTILLQKLKITFNIFLGQLPNPYYANAYAHAPQPQASKPAKPSYSSNPQQSVSWQQPLPWEAVTSYQSAPSPAKPNHSAPNRQRPQPSPKPSPRKHIPDTSRYSAPPQSYSHQYRQQGNQSGKPISWYHIDSPSKSI